MTAVSDAPGLVPTVLYERSVEMFISRQFKSKSEISCRSELGDRVLEDGVRTPTEALCQTLATFVDHPEQAVSHQLRCTSVKARAVLRTSARAPHPPPPSPAGEKLPLLDAAAACL